MPLFREFHRLSVVSVGLNFSDAAPLRLALGGVTGIIFATAASMLLASVMGVPCLFNPTINLLSQAFSAGIGVLFG